MSDYATAYRALISPEVTYENTVWGKLRKQGDKTYHAWHVLALTRNILIYRKVHPTALRKMSEEP